MPPYVEGPFMTVLHVMKTLPCLIAAVTTSPRSAYSQHFSQLKPDDATAAARTLSDTVQLSKLKRDLFFHWRADELLDKRQRVLNQVGVHMTGVTYVHADKSSCSSKNMGIYNAGNVRLAGIYRG